MKSKTKKGIALNKVPLILRTSCSISNAWSQSSTEEAVKNVQLWKKVLDLGHTKRVNLSLRLHGQLVLKH
jgi:hypothetical protein